MNMARNVNRIFFMFWFYKVKVILGYGKKKLIKVTRDKQLHGNLNT